MTTPSQKATSQPTKSIKRKVPCWVCNGQGGEEGERIDVGLGWGITEQISPDIECGLCNGERLITLGSKEHNEWRKNVMGLPKWRSK